MPMYEVTAPGFDGSTDATDDRVLWVLAKDYETVTRVAHEVPNTTVGLMSHSVEDCIADIDFILPREQYKLLAKLIRFELTAR